MLLNDGDDNWNSTQPLIGAVHELIVEFHDDILTIFPIIFSLVPRAPKILNQV